MNIHIIQPHHREITTVGCNLNVQNCMDGIVVLTIIILLIVLIVFIIGCILFWNNRQYDIVCPEGSCPTSLLTGQKDCTRSIYNPALEVCSLQYECSTDVLSEAVNSDLSTNDNGMCEVLPDGTSTQCRCSRSSMCPQYTVITFSQDSSGNIQQNINLDKTQSGLCSIAVESLFAPGGFCTPTDWSTEANKRADIIRCIQDNPCAQGQAAYLANPSEFRPTDYNYYPIACVPGITGVDSFNQPITGNSIPVWDDQWGGVVQVSLDV